MSVGSAGQKNTLVWLGVWESWASARCHDNACDRIRLWLSELPACFLFNPLLMNAHGTTLPNKKRHRLEYD